MCTQPFDRGALPVNHRADMKGRLWASIQFVRVVMCLVVKTEATLFFAVLH